MDLSLNLIASFSPIWHHYMPGYKSKVHVHILCTLQYVLQPAFGEGCRPAETCRCHKAEMYSVHAHTLLNTHVLLVVTQNSSSSILISVVHYVLLNVGAECFSYMIYGTRPQPECQKSCKKAQHDNIKWFKVFAVGAGPRFTN